MKKSREAYLQEVTLHEMKQLKQQIELSEYQDNWPILYAQEAENIKAALNGQTISIEHAGSTSVPGLCAKPIIDIVLFVKDSNLEETYVSALEKAGYTLWVREVNWYAHRLFKKQEPKVNVHVFSFGCEEAKRMLHFRDWLRTHEADMQLYAEAKRTLVQQNWKYVQEYADAKTEVVQTIIGHRESQ